MNQGKIFRRQVIWNEYIVDEISDERSCVYDLTNHARGSDIEVDLMRSEGLL